jgi:hypothetical protein
MKFGAEPKKIGALVGLLCVAGIVYWFNSSSETRAPSSSTRSTADPVAAVVSQSNAGGPKVVQRRSASGHPGSLGDVTFTLPDKIDPAKVDPKLRLDLLAKVQGIEMEGGVRNIFQVGQPPAEPAPVADKKAPEVPKVHPNAPPVTAAATPPAQPATPPAAPINLKYYGYSTKRSDGEKKAFFLDGDDIIVASEGEIIKKQYKVVRIGVNSVQMEDTASKSTQTIPLQQEAAPA